MMMETVIYSREFLYIKELYETGKMGRIQYLRATHQQEMLGWPGYWEGLPPMHYATHVVSPCLALPRRDAEFVTCFGSGRIQDYLIPKYNSPFAIETAHIKMKDSDIVAEVMRSPVQHGAPVPREHRRVRQQDGLRVAADRARSPGRPHRRDAAPGRMCSTTRTCCPRRFSASRRRASTAASSSTCPSSRDAGHGGSHPHMTHEFVMSIVEGREPFPNARQAANWTSVGILAHESAMQGGETMALPAFTCRHNWYAASGQRCRGAPVSDQEGKHMQNTDLRDSHPVCHHHRDCAGVWWAVQLYTGQLPRPAAGEC